MSKTENGKSREKNFRQNARGRQKESKFAASFNGIATAGKETSKGSLKGKPFSNYEVVLGGKTKKRSQ